MSIPFRQPPACKSIDFRIRGPLPWIVGLGCDALVLILFAYFSTRSGVLGVDSASIMYERASVNMAYSAVPEFSANSPWVQALQSLYGGTEIMLEAQLRSHAADSSPDPERAFQLEKVARDGAGDRVDCSVFARPRYARGCIALIQVVIYGAAAHAAAAALAKQNDTQTAERGVRVLTLDARRGAVFLFDLEISGLKVLSASNSLIHPRSLKHQQPRDSARFAGVISTA